MLSALVPDFAHETALRNEVVGPLPTDVAEGLSMKTNRRAIRAVGFYFAAFLLMTLVAGCSDDKIIYRERAPFNPPPGAALNFLGYYNATTKQTTCGNCHAGHQAKWKNTAHAGAYESLTSSGFTAPSCYGCHTTNARGNLGDSVVAGYDGVKDSAYFDVQCESCHGAGLEHIEGVADGNILVRPLAKISMVGVGNCGDCHSGTHNPFVEEWGASGHANVSASRAANPSCAGCHDGRGALARFGVDANYFERDIATAYQPTTCPVCHNPHGSPNSKQLRFSITSPDPEQNLCMKCHLRRTDPPIDGSPSPHAPQGAVLLGFAGWRPPGFVYDTARIYGSHATTANPKLCAGCHVGRITVSDPATGGFVFQATGHLMRPIPCLDVDGKPTADKTCAYNSTARSWATCSASGCHANAAVAASAFITVRSRMKFLTDQLWTDLNDSHSLQASPTDGGLLATIKLTQPTQWSTTDSTITAAEGAEFNARLCGEYGQSTADNSKGIHNPFLCEALLIATINYVRLVYNMPAFSAEVQAQLVGPIGGEFNRSMELSRRPPGQ